MSHKIRYIDVKFNEISLNFTSMYLRVQRDKTCVQGFGVKREGN